MAHSTAESLWSKAERAAWRPPAVLSPSEWAERYRVLTRRQSSMTGPWRNDQAPDLAGVMDLAVERGIDELTIVKAAQRGVSEAIRNVIGYCAQREPDPLLLVLPGEDTGTRIIVKRIIPLFQDTPVLRELFTDRAQDVQSHSLVLANGFTLSLGWSGSPATLAADPQRIVINDEVDKFAEWSGRESDPVSLGFVRTQTYGDRRKVINISTPTTRRGLITQRADLAQVKLYYFMPCPACGAFQRLTLDRLKWPPHSDKATPNEHAAEIELTRNVWYLCSACDAQIFEESKAGMVRAGVWAVSAEHARAGEKSGAVIREGWPAGTRVAMYLPCYTCLWIPWHAVAAEFVRTRGSLAGAMNFANSWAGEVFEQQVGRASSIEFASKCQAAVSIPPRVVPDWAEVLLATADVQIDRCYYVVRAWGAGFRSQRVTHGVCRTLAELKDLTLGTAFKAGTMIMRPSFLGVDANYRTQEVYQFCLTDPVRIKALRGETKINRPISVTRVTYRDPQLPESTGLRDLWLNNLNVEHYKDRLFAMVTAATKGTAIWELNAENDEDYNQQLASEHKILIREGRKAPVERWQLVTAGARNHYLDAEVYQLAMADIARVDLISGERTAPMAAVVRRAVGPADGPRRAPIRRHYG